MRAMEERLETVQGTEQEGPSDEVEADGIIVTFDADRQRIRAAVKAALDLVIIHLQDPVNQGRYSANQGGYFCLRSCTVSADAPPTLVELLGEVVPAARAGKRFALSQEKARRLAENSDHLSSWQSRDVAAERYGGAIRAGNRILSFSGLPEDADETVCTLAAHWQGLISAARVEEIARVSDNQTLQNLFAWHPRQP